MLSRNFRPPSCKRSANDSLGHILHSSNNSDTAFCHLQRSELWGMYFSQSTGFGICMNVKQKNKLQYNLAAEWHYCFTCIFLLNNDVYYPLFQDNIIFRLLPRDDEKYNNWLAGCRVSNERTSDPSHHLLMNLTMILPSLQSFPPFHFKIRISKLMKSVKERTTSIHGAR